MKTLMILVSMLISTVSMAVTELKTSADVTAAFAKGRPMVIMFYTTWCPACKATKPRYAKAEKVLKGKVDFYLMDVDKIGLGGPNPADRAGSRHEVNAIPSFSAGNTEDEVRAGTHFREGGGSVDALVDYIKSSTGLK
jgi:thiol-disulfide isomerase/thioredoxin